MSRGNTVMVKIDLSDETNKKWLHPTGKPVQHNSKPSAKKEEVKEEADNKYNPSQPRDSEGKWTSMGGGSGGFGGSSGGFKTAAQQEEARMAGLRNEAEAMVNAMKPDDEYLADTLPGIAKDLNLQAAKGPLKKPERMVEKTFEEDPGFKVTDMKDVVRGTLVLQSLAQKEAAIERIKQDFAIDRVKDLGSIDKEGYFDTKVNIKLPNSGYTGEIILIVPEMFNAKQKPTLYKETGHDMYDIIRDRKSTPQQVEAATSKSEKIYAAAKAKYLAREKSGEVLTVDFKK